MDSRFITRAIIVFAAALFQGTPAFFMYGIKPHLALAVISACVLTERSFARHAALICAGIAGFALQAGFIPAYGAFFAVLICAFIPLRSRLWRPGFAYAFSVAFSIVAFYALYDWRYLVSFPGMIAKEMIFTLAFGAIIYAVLVIPYEVRRGYQL